MDIYMHLLKTGWTMEEVEELRKADQKREDERQKARIRKSVAKTLKRLKPMEGLTPLEDFDF